MVAVTQEERKNPDFNTEGVSEVSGESKYSGKVKNQGTQDIKAPSQHTAPKKGTTKTGSDLRGGKK